MAVDKGEDNVLSAVTLDELNQLLETTIDKKLAPIKRTLAENSDKGPSLQDILGGIGYILGLAGIAAYVQSLKKRRSKIVNRIVTAGFLRPCSFVPPGRPWPTSA